MTERPESSTCVRFFTSAALRRHEEVAGEVAHWLPRWITVEYSEESPVVGTWKSAQGERRVCWYAREPNADLAAAHLERFGDEPFWIIDRSELGQGRLAVYECDGRAEVQSHRLWDFDKLDMPKREEVRSPVGVVRVVRTYECVSDGIVCQKTEAIPGSPAVVLPRPHAFPAPALAGEPFPCGRQLASSNGDRARLVESISHNDHQAIAYAVYRRGATWLRGVATVATAMAGWGEEGRSVMELEGQALPRLVLMGRLEGRLERGYPFFGVLEAIPQGRTLEDLVASQLVSTEDAIAVALEVGDIARRAHERVRQLGAIRPDQIYAQRVDGRLVVTAVLHRGPAVIARTYAGESVLWPPVPASDWGSLDDIRGLAQLVWFLSTGTHPFLRLEQIRWNPSWDGPYKRRRQPWSGPPALGALLERVLFEPQRSSSLEGFLAELASLRAVA